MTSNGCSIKGSRQYNGLVYTLLVLCIGGAVFWVYGRAVHAPFFFDDTFSIVINDSIKSLSPLSGPLHPPRDIPTSGRPLVNFTFALNYHFGKLNPVGYHVVNTIIHVLSSLVLMAIVRRTLNLDFFRSRFGRAAGPLSFGVALLWALHPLQTESVIYVTQRTELMLGFFYLSTLYAALRYWDVASTRNERILWLSLVGLASWSGAACKEVIVTAPVIVLLFERTFVTGSFVKAISRSRLLYGVLLSSWLLILFLNYHAPRSASAGFHLGVPAYAWWYTQMKVLMLYLKLVVWPWPLSINYEMPYLTTFSQAWSWLLPTVLLMASVAAAVWKRTAFGFVGVWVLVILSPTLVIPIVTEVAAERRMYLPLAALVALAIMGGYRLAAVAVHSLRTAGSSAVAGWSRMLTVLPAVALALLMGIISAHRLEAYRDELTLWQDTIRTNPSDFLAHNNLGIVLRKAGKTEEAAAHFKESVRLKPDYGEANFNLAMYLEKVGRPLDAMRHYKQAVDSAPGLAEAHNNLAILLAKAGRFEEAMDHFDLAIQAKPDYVEACNNMLKMLHELLERAQAQKNSDLAKQLERAISFYSSQLDAGK